MKKVLLGSIMFLSGIISSSILLGLSMVQDWTIDGSHSFLWNLSQYGLVPLLSIFIIIAVVGLILALWGVFEKTNKS